MEVDPISAELWAKVGGDLVPVVRLSITEVLMNRDFIDVSVLNPMKRNPARTRAAVIFARLTMRRPPPKYVLDGELADRTEYVAGLKEPPQISALIDAWLSPDAGELLADAMRGGQLLLVRDIKIEGRALVREYRREPAFGDNRYHEVLVLSLMPIEEAST